MTDDETWMIDKLQELERALTRSKNLMRDIRDQAHFSGYRGLSGQLTDGCIELTRMENTTRLGVETLREVRDAGRRQD